MNEFMINSISIILILVIVYLILINLIKLQNLKYRKKEYNLSKYAININTSCDNASTILDNLIEDIFNEYLILNIEYKEYPYINEELENQINKEVSEIVVNRLSQSIIDKLCLTYNKNSIGDIIAKKVYLRTITYTMKKNKK